MFYSMCCFRIIFMDEIVSGVIQRRARKDGSDAKKGHKLKPKENLYTRIYSICMCMSLKFRIAQCNHQSTQIISKLLYVICLYVNIHHLYAFQGFNLRNVEMLAQIISVMIIIIIILVPNVLQGANR